MPAALFWVCVTILGWGLGGGADAAAAADRTIAARLGEPVEIPMPPSDALAEWIIQDMTAAIVEHVAVRRLPAETVFLFRPTAVGTTLIRFAKKAVGSAGPMALTDRQEGEVIVTAGQSKSAKLAGPRTIPALKKPAGEKADAARAPSATAAPVPANYSGDPLILDMLEGQLGFPAENPPPYVPTETELALMEKYPLPFSYYYVIPKGSYLLNPSHQLPLPDTPPAVDTPQYPAYHHALALARRGLLKQASDALEELIKEQRGKPEKNAAVEAFYQFVNAHIKLANKEYGDAAKKFKTLYADRDYGPASRFYAALATEWSGDTLGAISGYQGALSRYPKSFFAPEAAWRIARIFLNARAFDRARLEYEEFIQKNARTPFIDDAIMDLAYIHDQIYAYQDFELAIKLYDTLATQYAESLFADTAQARKKFILENYY